MQSSTAQTLPATERESLIGREISVPTHLTEGQEFSIPPTGDAHDRNRVEAREMNIVVHVDYEASDHR